MDSVLTSIATAFARLSAEGIDGFEVDKRRVNSVQKHLKIDDLKKMKDLKYDDLFSYLEHLRSKYKTFKKESA